MYLEQWALSPFTTIGEHSSDQESQDTGPTNTTYTFLLGYSQHSTEPRCVDIYSPQKEEAGEKPALETVRKEFSIDETPTSLSRRR